jgi:hypothetical protein
MGRDGRVHFIADIAVFVEREAGFVPFYKSFHV